jgi:hypothetical protein
MSRAITVALPPGARFALIATCLLLGWCVVRDAANQLWSIDEPHRAALFWPAGGAALSAIAQARIIAAGGHVDDRAGALLGTALRRAPRRAEPLILAGLAASDRGDLARAERLMAAARARDPRAAIVRSWRLDHFMRTGEYAAALGEVGPVLRLRPRSQGPILAILAALLETSGGTTALRGALAREPDWRATFFTTAAQYGADPAALAGLLSLMPPARDVAAARIEQSAVLRALIDRGDYAGAYRMWRGFLPAAYRGPIAGLYDPRFAGWPGAPPFTWSLQPGADGVARIDAPSGDAARPVLTLGAGGTGAAVLAEQYAIVDPGDYALSVVARRIGYGRTRLAAGIVCTSDASILATLPLEAVAPRFTLYRVAAKVPARCGAIRVQFAAAAGEGRAAASVQLAAAQLARR